MSADKYMKNSFDIAHEAESFISSKKAAELLGYAPDHVGRLCRLGKVRSRRVGKDWFVSEQDLYAYHARINGSVPIFSPVQEQKPVIKTVSIFETLRPYTVFVKPIIFGVILMVAIMSAPTTPSADIQKILNVGKKNMERLAAAEISFSIGDIINGMLRIPRAIIAGAEAGVETTKSFIANLKENTRQIAQNILP